MKLSLQTNLYNLIKAKGSLGYGEMAEFTNNEQFKVSTAERKLRLLVEEGKIENVYKNSKKGKPYICGYKLPSDYVEPVKTNYVIINGEKVYV
jgi:predicted transcriptional regulator